MIIKKGRQGILYLDKAPKFAVEAPTPMAKTMAKTKQKTVLGSLKIIRNVRPTPALKKMRIKSKANANASVARGRIVMPT